MGISVPVGLVAAIILFLIVALLIFFCYKQHKLRHGLKVKTTPWGRGFGCCTELALLLVWTNLVGVPAQLVYCKQAALGDQSIEMWPSGVQWEGFHCMLM